jgi:phospholipid/cholesterol/gamma-HCH transport system substrate-binding protein
LFIISTVAILAAGSFLIGERQSLFTPTYRVMTTFKTVTGLSEGAEVRIGGIRRGTVKRILLPTRPDGEMTVLMNLETSTRAVVRSDSIASIGTDGLLGNKFVNVSFGSDAAPAIASGDRIASAPPLDISDLMNKTNQILDATKDTMGNVQESADHLKDISGKIDRGEGTMGALVNDKQMYTRLNSATMQAQQGAAAFTEDMDALKHNVFLRGFFNSRGYDDPTKLTEHLITQLPGEPALQTFRYDVKNLFVDVDHARLKNEHAMNDAGQYLQRTPFGEAVIVAASGMKGDSADLKTLLEARAMVIRDYLVKNFRMDDTRVKTMALGKGAEPSSDTGTVSVMIYPPSVRPGKSAPGR